MSSTDDPTPRPTNTQAARETDEARELHTSTEGPAPALPAAARDAEDVAPSETPAPLMEVDGLEQPDELQPRRFGLHEDGRRANGLRRRMMASRPGGLQRRYGRGRGLLPWIFGLATGAALCAEPAQAWQDTTPRAHWRGQSFLVGDWPPALPSAHQALLEEWTPCAELLGYRLDLDPSGRVLLLSSSETSSTWTEMKLAGEALEQLDTLLPLPDRGAFTAQAETLPRRQGTDQAVVLLRLEGRDDYRQCLELFAEEHAYLRAWIEGASETTGFLLDRPFCAGWLTSDRGDEEWSEKNEFASRLGLALVRSRYGRQPHWLEQGLAWNFEQALTGDIWCFPGRDGFVARDEHDGWSRELKAAHRKGRKSPLSFEPLSDWKRGEWSEEAASSAWGLVEYLEAHRAGSLSLLATEYGAWREHYGRTTGSDGRWTRIPNYEVPGETQLELLQRYAGGDVLAEAAEYFKRGRTYKDKGRGR